MGGISHQNKTKLVYHLVLLPLLYLIRSHHVSLCLNCCSPLSKVTIFLSHQPLSSPCCYTSRIFWWIWMVLIWLITPITHLGGSEDTWWELVCLHYSQTNKVTLCSSFGCRWWSASLCIKGSSAKPTHTEPVLSCNTHVFIGLKYKTELCAHRQAPPGTQRSSEEEKDIWLGSD